MEQRTRSAGNKAAVIGAGAWGTTLADLLAKNGFEVKLWALEKSTVEDINNCRENKSFLPGIKLSGNITASYDIEGVLPATLVIIAIPTKFLRSALDFSKGYRISGKDLMVLSAVKGIEKGTLLRPSQMIEEALGIKNAAVISGPNLSREIASGLPAASVIACRDKKIASRLQKSLSSNTFRTYTSQDVTGVELGGALKNVIAIAAGICDGLKLGSNAKAALMVRGMAEIMRMGMAAGAKKETFFGLSGIGDLMTTCSSDLSRNHFVGIKIAQANDIKEILSSMNSVPEGVDTVISVLEMSRKLKIDMPITREVHSVLFEGKSPAEAISCLMSRQLKTESY